ncbi:MAG: carbamate kinase [Candidatus Melainabacteria bacterium]|nr:carbamate kinase [Candidatus Melainabacteria bacterium]
MTARERVLIAIGGNALYDKTGENNLDPAQVQAICQKIVAVVQQGYLPVITFGNGPQVGNLLDMAETRARASSRPIPLDTCVAWTQGEIGYALSQELTNQLRGAECDLSVMAVNSTVVVAAEDPAFQKPTKPVGRFITPEEAQRLYMERGWIVGPDANRGYRRLVPSPKPIAVLEAPAIAGLLQQQVIVLCGGGGGIPVCWEASTQSYRGLEAVIDKDYTSCLLAKTLRLEHLVICTEVEYVYLHYGTPQQTALEEITLAEAEAFDQQGQFAEGSMGPKVRALMDYVRHGGKRAMITRLDCLTDALAGKTGTRIVASISQPAFQSTAVASQAATVASQAATPAS